jgi:hypothetical protein
VPLHPAPGLEPEEADALRRLVFVSQLIAIERVEHVAPPEETTDDLHAEIALVDQRIDDLRTYRVELIREIIRRQLRAATNSPGLAKASKQR